MANTTRIAQQSLDKGNMVSTTVYPGSETLALDLIVTLPYAPLSSTVNVVMVARDAATGLVKDSLVLHAAGIERMLIDGIEGQALIVEVMNLGDTVLVQADEVTGIEATSGGARLDADDIPDGSILVTKIGPGAVTPAKLSGFNTIKCLAFVGVAAAGPCNCVGAAVGDRVIAVFGASTAAGANAVGVPNNGATFETVITVVDQIQQTAAADWSAITLIVLLAPAAA